MALINAELSDPPCKAADNIDSLQEGNDSPPRAKPKGPRNLGPRPNATPPCHLCSENCSRISDLHDFHDSIRLYHERADPYLNARSSSLQRKNSSLSAVSALEGNGDWGDRAEPLGSTVIGSTEVHAGAGSSSQVPRP